MLEQQPIQLDTSDQADNDEHEEMPIHRGFFPVPPKPKPEVQKGEVPGWWRVSL